MKNGQKKSVLDKVNFPQDLKRLKEVELLELSEEIRDFLVRTVSRTGGHLGSNLGIVELTIALHRVFDAPKDKLIWDVGHQAYTHKILTGRKSRMETIRQKGGLAPFPKKEESEYDAFNVGHSSTSISIATGMALATQNKKNPPQVVAIIGDGALTGGMALEALNHAGDIKANLLVILNDNKMSISPNVGGMGKYLARLLSSPAYIQMRKSGQEILRSVPTIEKIVSRAETQAKGMVVPGTFFEEIGFKYYGPIDGHDTLTLIEVLNNLKKIKGPKFLHIITKKGKGYALAEKDEFSFHAVQPFDPITGKRNGNGQKKINYTDIFSQWINKKAQEDLRLHAITPAMCEGSGLTEFSKKFSKRYHDVGIAEQHAMTLAAGFASQGKKPVVAIYSSFLQRAFDQLIHDVALPKMDVLLAIDRAGIVGPDGMTHAGIFDLSFMRIIPNLIIMAPADNYECQEMLEAGYNQMGPVAVRYPRGSGESEIKREKNKPIEIGRGEIVQAGEKVAILAFGAMVERSQKAANELNATLVNMRFVKPLDENLLREIIKSHDYLVTVEDNVVIGGAGSAVNEFFSKENILVKIKNLGVPDKIIDHGTREEILADLGLDEKGILNSIGDFIKSGENV